ncbi:hypothetical protein PHLGIDRAFT_488790 [Phlebiopsis gigantea 11061_1 CR5-6]|uniref:Cytochrome P450 n=1 Tax=Phlebiopsis gigantea (strain 11061_1 CR5-6) TaxID=745531 RepID=A0A0C3SEJ4_PHLG1|nr:hypothetical protein PHLGIDRAFT_488790 [Phlebiopsis gigantea 11061_1 CR5-6]
MLTRTTLILLNPVFSTAHMRRITPLFYEATHRPRAAISNQIATSDDVDVLSWMGRCALELIGKCGLGYSFDSLVENDPNVYGDALVLIPLSARLIPLSLRRLAAPWIPHEDIQSFRQLLIILDEQSRCICANKKAAIAEGDEAVISRVNEGADILSVLMKANIEASDEDRLPENETIAQISSLTLAGTWMDTTSNALARVFHLLSEYPNVQDKFRAELLSASVDGAGIPYELLHELPYLDAVCRETLVPPPFCRYPPVTFMNRECVDTRILISSRLMLTGMDGGTRADIVMPLFTPIQGLDGTKIIEIPAGEDALVWRPERWLKPALEALPEARVPGIYSQLMTFLGGGRACIGFKFSQTEMKTVLSVLLQSFRFSASDKEIYWNMAAAYHPTVGRNSSKPAMYLKVEAV